MGCREERRRDADGIIFNLIGHGLAELLHGIYRYADLVLHKDIALDAAVRCAIRASMPDVEKLAQRNEHFVRRELEETVKALELQRGPLAGVELHEYAGRARWLLPRSPDAA